MPSSRRPRRLCLLTLAWLVAGGCTSQQRPDSPRKTLDIPALRLRAFVPEDAVVSEKSDGTHITLGPMARYAKEMQIAPAGESADLRFDRRDGALHYRIDIDEDSGMGGPYYTLLGRVEVAGRRIDVNCQEQSEDSTDLGWCLDIVRTFEASPR
ncbi:hypothetical protein [Nannocystis punicea]|uniref:Type six secretion immunity 3 domain-containing protein n=1 Tax=Nannocystis punicea TaxID=2995304 RepID=A0ABY7HAX3_9BACT|nr:hypothetical protein [Nannocystis poenicansa]WAS96435.1 hypothetical protein O0S08_09775 [Nannocystis poenicansa]